MLEIGKMANVEGDYKLRGFKMQREFGDYLLTRQIGYGSLGETYLAEHRYLKTPFIVKILPPEISSDPQFIERFEQEVPKLARLDHPHIAKIHNALFSSGVWALVSEAVLNPISLIEVTLSESQILHIVRQLASALEYGHQEKVMHGSIKLTNVMLKQSEAGFDAFLTDFGLSSIISPVAVLGRVYHYISNWMISHGDLCLSKEFYKAGACDLLKSASLQRSFCERFFFLAPEQKLASSSLSFKSDGYSLGILTYYLLTETFPEGRFPLPSAKRGDLIYNWDEWLSQWLHPDPLHRPESLSLSLEELVVSLAPISAVQKVKELRALSERPKEALVGSGHVKPILRPKEIIRPSFDADPAAVFQIDTTVATYKPQPKEDREIEPLQTEMVIIPEGTYVRGSNHGGRDEMPRHAVFVHAFAIDIHPVTNEQFALFLEAMGGEKDRNNSDIILLRDSRIKRSGGKLSIEAGYSKHPVVGVSWYGAVAYAKWVGKRLPTEAEWEIAAYGGREDITYPMGNQIERTDANFFSSDTTAVMSYRPNPLGLFDMAGNVYEWCQDWYDFHFYDLSVQEPNNPKGPSQGVYRVLRGGCWKSSKEDLRCAHRHRNNPGLMNGTYGFRCATDVM